MDLLWRIKGLVIRGRVLFTEQAKEQMRLDNLERYEVIESIVNAGFVRTKRSRSRRRGRKNERVHIIEGFSLRGILIYTKGVLRKNGGEETLYVLISAKRSVRSG